MCHDHQLLMEALMLFSSEESDSSVFSEDSEAEAKADASRSAQFASRDESCDDRDDHNDDSFLDSAVQDVLSELVANQRKEDEVTRQQQQLKRDLDTLLQAPTNATPRYGRKRSKKCTYAARRHEVSRLRQLSKELENQLDDLKISLHHERQNTSRCIEFEHDQLVKSQAENARLRAMIEVRDERVRQLQASMHHGDQPPL